MNTQPDDNIKLTGFYLSDWHIDPPSCLITRGDETLHLEPKAMDLLVYMAQQPDKVHSRDELLENIWTGVIVSDEALTNAIIKIRKAFNETAKNPKIIETLPKRGYRLIAEVTPTVTLMETQALAETQSKVRFQPGYFVWLLIAVLTLGAIFWSSTDSPSPTQLDTQSDGLTLPDKPSIAVLPFVNNGNEIEHAYFSDGITDDLITDLSKLSGLFVISRNSTFQYKGQAVDVKHVAETLGVRYILEGSVRRIGDQVRINTQLIDGQTGGQLWAERYDGNLGDVFKLQDRVTSKIIQALALRLTEQDKSQLTLYKSTSPEAYDEYLKGWEHHWRVNREDFAQAEIHFKKALELDPKFERARVALALIYWQSWQQQWHMNSGRRGAGWGRARQELDSITQPFPMAYSLYSSMHLYNRRYEDAISMAQLAIDLNPSSATGYLALAQAMGFSGQPEKAIALAKKAFRLDPNFPVPYLFIEALSLFDLKKYQQALVLLKRINTSQPEHKESQILQIASYGQLGKIDQAQPVMEKLNLQLRAGKLPDLTIDWEKSRWPYQDYVARDHLMEGLKKAGVPAW